MESPSASCRPLTSKLNSKLPRKLLYKLSRSNAKAWTSSASLQILCVIPDCDFSRHFVATIAIMWSLSHEKRISNTGAGGHPAVFFNCYNYARPLARSQDGFGTKYINPVAKISASSFQRDIHVRSRRRNAAPPAALKTRSPRHIRSRYGPSK